METLNREVAESSYTSHKVSGVNLVYIWHRFGQNRRRMAPCAISDEEAKSLMFHDVDARGFR
jgi:hypothetical protein